MPELSPEVARELDALDAALAGRPVAPDLTDLGDLALLLREERPKPDDGFGRRLDAGVQRGFPDRDPRTRTTRKPWYAWRGWMSPALGTTAVVALVVVAAVTGGGGDSQGEGGGGTAAPAAESAGASQDAARAESAQDSAGGGAASSLAAPEGVPPAPAPGSPGTDGRDRRRVERSASLTLAARPREIDGVSARIQEVTRQQGGFVVSSTVSSSAGEGAGTFELRIPTRNLDAAMAALARLGAVRERAQRSEDITARSVSARSRLKDAKTERESLLRQLAAAVTLTQTQSIRTRLRLVAGEIERARADVRRVDNRAAFSTVVVTLVADRHVGAATAGDGDGWTPGDAAHDALRVLEVLAGVALIALAIGLPLALLALVVALGLRLARRRRREQALDAV